VLAEPATALLVAGIVNPFGPTLAAVIVVGKLKPGAKLPVARLVLNPFNQEVDAVGNLAVGKKMLLSAVMPPLFSLPFGSCPSVLLPSIHLEDDHSVALHAEFLRGFNEARDVLQQVRRYLGNPWDRVSAEVRRGAEQFAELGAGVSGGVDPEPLDEAEARELARLLLSEQHMKPELQAFFYAWSGSIDHMAPGLATMSFATFASVFEHVTSSCQVPGFVR
jgi:hypothetical protein